MSNQIRRRPSTDCSSRLVTCWSSSHSMPPRSAGVYETKTASSRTNAGSHAPRRGQACADGVRVGRGGGTARRLTDPDRVLLRAFIQPVVIPPFLRKDKSGSEIESLAINRPESSRKIHAVPCRPQTRFRVHG